MRGRDSRLRQRARSGRMTNEQYLRELARALTRREDLTTAEAKEKLYELALRLYALLLTRLPPTRFERELRWPALRAEALRAIEPVAQELYALLTEGVIAAENEAVRLALQLYGLPRGAIAPRPTAQLLLETRVLAQSLSVLGTPSGVTGTSPLALQLMRLLERSVFPAIYADLPIAEVAGRVAQIRTRNGQREALATKGSVANGWRERFRGITAAAVWGPVAIATERAAAVAVAQGIVPASAPPLWRWNAVLDPRTCPICRPLDGTTAGSPRAFPLGPPPLHPLCRCVVLPARS